MHKLKKFLKRIIIDAAGYILILLALLLGWLPGPGGIPLLLGGLGLLAINNAWARRILMLLKKSGSKLTDFIFLDKPWIMALHDLFAIALVLVAGFIISRNLSPFTIGVAVALLALSAADFAYNRNRWQRFTNKK